MFVDGTAFVSGAVLVGDVAFIGGAAFVGGTAFVGRVISSRKRKKGRCTLMRWCEGRLMARCSLMVQHSLVVRRSLVMWHSLVVRRLLVARRSLVVCARVGVVASAVASLVGQKSWNRLVRGGVGRNDVRKQ